MRYRFHPAAKTEINEAIDYYESRQTGLGGAFAKEVYSTVQRVFIILRHGPNYQKIPEGA